MDLARIEHVEIAAVADLFAAAPPAVADVLGVAAATIGGAFCSSTTGLASSRELNHVHGLGIDGAAVTDAALDAIAAWYAERDGAHVVGIVPGADPGLEPALTSRGFVPTRAWSKFVHEEHLTEPAPPTDLRIDDAAPAEFGAVVVGGFGFPDEMAPWIAALPGRPGWTCLVARDLDGTALGAGALFIGDGAAWLGLGATLPAGRGRGAQRALLARRIACARDHGCDLVTTETGTAVPGSPQQSHRNIGRAGFRVAYERRHLASPGFPA